MWMHFGWLINYPIREISWSTKVSQSGPMSASCTIHKKFCAKSELQFALRTHVLVLFEWYFYWLTIVYNSNGRGPIAQWLALNLPARKTGVRIPAAHPRGAGSKRQLRSRSRSSTKKHLIKNDNDSLINYSWRTLVRFARLSWTKKLL